MWDVRCGICDLRCWIWDVEEQWTMGFCYIFKKQSAPQTQQKRRLPRLRDCDSAVQRALAEYLRVFFDALRRACSVVFFWSVWWTLANLGRTLVSAFASHCLTRFMRAAVQTCKLVNSLVPPRLYHPHDKWAASDGADPS